jgi:hypothetical protein
MQHRVRDLGPPSRLEIPQELQPPRVVGPVVQPPRRASRTCPGLEGCSAAPRQGTRNPLNCNRKTVCLNRRPLPPEAAAPPMPAGVLGHGQRAIWPDPDGRHGRAAAALDYPAVHAATSHAATIESSARSVLEDTEQLLSATDKAPRVDHGQQASDEHISSRHGDLAVALRADAHVVEAWAQRRRDRHCRVVARDRHGGVRGTAPARPDTDVNTRVLKARAGIWAKSRPPSLRCATARNARPASERRYRLR